MAEYFDTLETRDPELRERALLAALPRQLARAKANAPAFARILAGVDPAAITTRDALARLPVTRKSELADLQKGARPFGGLAAVRRSGAASACSRRRGRFTNPRAGVRTTGASRRALFAAGFRRGDLVHNCFSYHLTPAGSMLETGAHALGCTRLRRRHRPDRAAGAGDGRPRTRRLRRHPFVPADHPRQGGRAGRFARKPQEGARVGRGLSDEPRATR